MKQILNTIRLIIGIPFLTVFFIVTYPIGFIFAGHKEAMHVISAMIEDFKKGQLT